MFDLDRTIGQDEEAVGRRILFDDEFTVAVATFLSRCQKCLDLCIGQPHKQGRVSDSIICQNHNS